MEIEIMRRFRGGEYTIGVLSIDGEKVCDTLEPTDRGLSAESSLKDVMAAKAFGITAIPTGVYRLKMMYSSHFSAMRPYLLRVRGYSGVMIHEGNRVRDTKGCILVGRNTRKGMVLESGAVLKSIIGRVKEAEARHESVMVRISRR